MHASMSLRYALACCSLNFRTAHSASERTASLGPVAMKRGCVGSHGLLAVVCMVEMLCVKTDSEQLGLFVGPTDKVVPTLKT